MSATQSLPELPEVDAPASIATIYEELKQLSGTPMVALIWRHLATYPDVLPVVWAALAPLFRAGLVQEAAWRAAETGVDAPPSKLTRARLSAIGLAPDDQSAFARVLDAYNRANPVNFVGVRLLVRAMTRDVGGPPPKHSAWRAPEAIGGLPAMVPIAKIGHGDRAMIDALSSDPALDRSRVVPSLYRHLTEWPGLIGAIHDDLAPRFKSGEMARVIGAAGEAMDGEAARLDAYMKPLPGLATLGPISETLEKFSALIPEMVTVGLLLKRGIDAPAHS